MTELITFLQMPLPSLGGLLLLWIIAEKAGIPITKLFSSLLNIKKKDDEVPAWAAKLTAHFNDETTEKLDRMLFKQDALKDCVKKANTHLEEIKEYGVPLRSSR